MVEPEFRVLSEGGVTAPRGFLAGAVYAGLQLPAPDQRDLGALFADRPCVAVARFTPNLVVAAPVVLSRERIAAGRPCAAPSSTRAMRTPVPAPGNAGGERDVRAGRAAPRGGGGGASRRIDRRDRGAARHGQGPGRDRAARSRRRDGGPAVARAIMTTDLAPEAGGGGVRARRAHGADRWDGEGLGDDPSGPGDDARFPDDRRAA